MKKKLWVPIGITVSFSSSFLAASCKKEVNENDQNTLPSLPSNFEEIFNLKIKNGKNRDNLTAETIANDWRNLLSLTINDKYKNTLNYEVVSVNRENNSNATGIVNFSIKFTDKKTQKSVIKSFKLPGFKKQVQNNDSTIPSRPQTLKQPDKYITSNQIQRYQIDNDAYHKEQDVQYKNRGVDIIKTRSDLNYLGQNAQQFDKKAQIAGVPSYENSLYRGYTLPRLEANGSIGGLVINTYPDSIISRYSRTDFLSDRDPSRTEGLARLLPNQTYKRIGLETYAVSFKYKYQNEKEIQEIQQKINKLKEYQAQTNAKELLNQYFIEPSVREEETKIKILENEREIKIAQAVAVDKPAISRHYDSLVNERKNAINQIKKYTYSDVLKLFEKEIENQKNDAKTYNRIKAPRGTMWIMDYKISENSKYPTKWYFGTNSHVARDIMQPEFSSISMSVMKPNVGLLTRFRILGLDEKFITYGWDDPKVKQAVKRVYDATDYLKTSPKDYLDSSQKEKFASIEEMIDFAVVEIDFDILASIHNKLVAWSNEKSVEIKPMSGEELARLVTNDYASRDPKDKVKFLANSYLKNYNKIDFELQYPEANGPRKTDELFALGYPGAIYDYFLRKYIDQDQIDRAKDYQTLWTNSDYRFFSQRPIQEGGKPSVDEKKLNRGNYLSYNIGFRTFIDKPGLNDGFIANPVRGNEIYSTFDEEGKQKQYWNTGLQYMLRHFVGREGSSGSSVRNQNNEIIGVHSSIAPDSKTDFVSAFRSEGYDYKGVYGKYNLPQYDLIYGGGKDQKTSYRQALEKMYKNQNYKTYIFQNGTDENNIPNEFKFDKIKLLNQ